VWSFPAFLPKLPEQSTPAARRWLVSVVESGLYLENKQGMCYLRQALSLSSGKGTMQLIYMVHVRVKPAHAYMPSGYLRLRDQSYMPQEIISNYTRPRDLSYTPQRSSTTIHTWEINHTLSLNKRLATPSPPLYCNSLDLFLSACQPFNP
jgi:hypothetical protein